MWQLRTTIGLSVAALFVGTLGTAWLSHPGAGWQAAPRAVARAQSQQLAAKLTTPTPTLTATLPRRQLVPPPRMHARNATDIDRRLVQADADAGAPPPTLVPLSTPADPMTWEKLRGHLDGTVLLRITVNGAGRVTAAQVMRSSGDGVLDAHALATASRWRFMVPASDPKGFSGELPMRFASAVRGAAP